MATVTPQLVCIFCGHNRVISNNFRLKGLHVDPSEWGVISFRSVGPGPGRGHKGESGEGLRVVGRLNLIEALQDPDYMELAEQIRQRFISILKSYLASGLIDFEELT